MVSVNVDKLESAGTLAGTDKVSVWKENKAQQSTVAAIATYVAGAGLNITGNITGNVTGSLYGGAAVFTPSVLTESGQVPAVTFVQLDHATVKIEAVMTPTVGQLLVISQKDAGTVGHTVTTAGTFDGTNNTATFNAANETLVLFGVSATRWVIIQNIGSVALSAVA